MNAAGSVAASFGSLEAASPPPWMANEVADRGYDQVGTPVYPAASGEQVQPGTLDLPEWLRDESDPSSFDFEPPELDLIDDEDLPAWIPELAKTETGEYDRPPVSRPPEDEIPRVRHQPVVPPVSRAWLTQSPRQPAPDVAVNSGLIVDQPPAATAFAEAPELEMETPPTAADESEPTSEAPVVATAESVTQAPSSSPDANQAASPEPAVSDEAPEVAEAAGPVLTGQAAQIEQAPLGAEVAVATAAGGPIAQESGNQSLRRVVVVIVGLLILALIVAAVFLYLFVFS